jgi:hypothetical protein
MFLTFRLRHYWSKASYLDFHELTENGLLGATAYDGLDEDGQPVHDVNFNAFTIDAVFTWRFAPGSDLFVVWKDGIFASDNDPARDYFVNLERTFRSQQANNLSVRVVWYLDYVLYRRWRDRRAETREGAGSAALPGPGWAGPVPASRERPGFGGNGAFGGGPGAFGGAASPNGKRLPPPGGKPLFRH